MLSLVGFDGAYAPPACLTAISILYTHCMLIDGRQLLLESSCLLTAVL